MVQKRVSGITLHDYLRKTKFSPTSRYCRDMLTEIIAQQNVIGYNHKDNHSKNIMVDSETGKFKTLIDWDKAALRTDRRIENSKLIFKKYCSPGKL
jgi:hypothetical protein